MRIAMIGEGAQAYTYMDALANIEDVEVPLVVGGIEAGMQRFADKYNIASRSLEFDDALADDRIDALIVTSPSQLHFEHACKAIAAGKHLLLEIPMALNLADSMELADRAAATDRTCMVAHTRHYAPLFQRIRNEIAAGELDLHHLVTQTYFFRRQNLNRFGEPRTWVDDILWHHACHTVDLFHWMVPDPEPQAWGLVGPNHAELGIPMDLTVGLKSREGKLLTGALSFNHHGPLHVQMRFIGEQRSYLVDSLKSTLSDTEGNLLQTDPPGAAVTGQCRVFVDCAREGTTPPTDFAYCAGVMRILDQIERALHSG